MNLKEQRRKSRLNSYWRWWRIHSVTVAAPQVYGKDRTLYFKKLQ